MNKNDLFLKRLEEKTLNYSNSELVNIINSTGSYIPEAVEAAKKEIEKRGGIEFVLQEKNREFKIEQDIYKEQHIEEIKEVKEKYHSYMTKVIIIILLLVVLFIFGYNVSNAFLKTILRGLFICLILALWYWIKSEKKSE